MKLGDRLKRSAFLVASACLADSSPKNYFAIPGALIQSLNYSTVLCLQLELPILSEKLLQTTLQEGEFPP